MRLARRWNTPSRAPDGPARPRRNQESRRSSDLTFRRARGVWTYFTGTRCTVASPTESRSPSRWLDRSARRRPPDAAPPDPSCCRRQPAKLAQTPTLTCPRTAPPFPVTARRALFRGRRVGPSCRRVARPSHRGLLATGSPGTRLGSWLRRPREPDGRPRTCGSRPEAGPGRVGLAPPRAGVSPNTPAG